MQRTDKKRWAILLGLLLFLFLTVIVALMAGPLGPIGSGVKVGQNKILKMSPGDFFNAITGNAPADSQMRQTYELYRNVLIDSRLPRVLLAMLVGCALSLSGTTMQALFKNPMADPYIIGISSGAAVGASASVFIHMGGNASIYILPLFAFIGALVTVFAVYAVAKGAGGRIRTETLLLTGIAVGSFLGAVTAFMMYASGMQFQFLFFWMLGGLGSPSWEIVMIVAVPVIFGAIVLQFYARDLNALMLGEEPATHLGVDVETTKKILLVLSALLAGTAVAFAGIIGFVGLIVPHMVRILVGPNHRIMLPAATIAGGIFLVIADTVARTVNIGPAEIPLGIITALCGAPFFIYLLSRGRKR
jgi:iron complex transport system permease protein